MCLYSLLKLQLEFEKISPKRFFVKMFIMILVHILIEVLNLDNSFLFLEEWQICFPIHLVPMHIKITFMWYRIFPAKMRYSKNFNFLKTLRLAYQMRSDRKQEKTGLMVPHFPWALWLKVLFALSLTKNRMIQIKGTSFNKF